MEPKKYQRLFREIIKQRHDMEIDFKTIERSLKHIRKGDRLTYSDLEIIESEQFWPFKKYWRWPAKEQIEGELKKTKGLFLEPISKEYYEKK